MYMNKSDRDLLCIDDEQGGNFVFAQHGQGLGGKAVFLDGARVSGHQCFSRLSGLIARQSAPNITIGYDANQRPLRRNNPGAAKTFFGNR